MGLERESEKAKAEPIAEHRRPKKEEDKGNNVTFIEQGNKSDYLTARIARDRPDVLARSFYYQPTDKPDWAQEEAPS